MKGPAIAILAAVAVVAAGSGHASGAASSRCQSALPRAPLGLPAPVIVTTSCGRFRLDPAGGAVYLGPRMKGVKTPTRRSLKGVKTPTRRSRVDLAVCLAAVLRAHGGFGTMWFCSEVRSRLGLGVPVFLCFTRAREYQKPLNGAKNGQL